MRGRFVGISIRRCLALRLDARFREFLFAAETTCDGGGVRGEGGG